MATTVNQEMTHGREPQEDSVLNAVFARALTLNWQVILFTAIFLLAIFTRFYDLGERVMSHDESLHTQYSYNLYQEGQFEHTPLMHGPILFHFTALSYFLFGDNDFSSRIYPALLGVLLVMTPLLFRRWLGKWGTILASLMFLISPLLMYYNRYLRHDTPSILSAVVMAWAIMMYLSGPENQRRRAHWLYIIAGAMVWNLGSKETAFIYVAIFGAFLTMYWVVRLVQHFYHVNGKPLFETVGMGFALAGVFSLLMILTFTVGLGNTGVVGGQTLADRLNFIGDQFGVLLRGEPVVTDFATFLSWLGLSVVFMLVTTIGTGLWVFRRKESSFQPTDGLIILIDVLLLWALSLLTSLAFALIVVLSLTLIYAALRFRSFVPFGRPLLALLGIVLVLSVGLLVFEELSHEPARERSNTEVQQQPVPGEETELVVVESEFTLLPIVAVWVLGIVIVGGLFYARTAGWFDVLDLFPEFDILIVMGSLILPWLTAFFIYATNPDAEAYASIANNLPTFLFNMIPTGSVGAGMEAARVGRVLVGFLAWLPMMGIAVAAGLIWNWRRWIVCFAIFHIIFAFFFTTVFTNIQGLATGMIYSLEYWLEQQGEQRGSQPQHYYLMIIMPMYEYLPIIGSVLAMFGGMVVFWRRKRAYIERDQIEDQDGLLLTEEVDTAEDVNGQEVVKVRQVDPRFRLDQLPFLLFVAFWAVLNLYAYTLSGEKMPWLGTHMTTPMILLTAWYFGRVFDRIDVSAITQRRGWMFFILLPLGLIVTFQIIAPFFGTQAPFQGTSRLQQTWTYQWLAVVFVGGIILFVVLRLVETTGWPHLRRMLALALFAVLAVITFRAAWGAAFIRYEEATEYLVYAHGGPGNAIMYDTLRELSIRTTGGMDLRFAYDDGMSWPGSWYFRDFDNALYYGSNPTLRQLEDVQAVVVRDDGRAEVEPLLGDAFIRYDYVRMWWPMEDYKNLNASRMNNLLDFNSDNQSAAATRRGIFDIWWSRDYDQYAQATGNPDRFNLTTWPVRDDLSLYIRKDIAAQVWPYGVGDGSPLTVLNQVEENLCLANWQPIPASVVFNTSASPLMRPIGMDVTQDGLVYVAQEGNTQTGESMQISVYDTDGNFVESFGRRGMAEQVGAFFERPHSVAVNEETGLIYVADTWNYLIRVFNQDYEQVDVWGEPYSAGIDAQPEPFGGFWGPRDVAIDEGGRVYVADTGNKRIRVYTAEGDYLLDIGSGGSGDGQLDEPAGIALHPDGRVFVADTWNRRVSVFLRDGTPMSTFTVRGWASEPINRPYLALDVARDILYVTDPDAGRILVYDTAGNCIGAFGQFNSEAPDNTQFSGLGGIDVDEAGNVYAVDTVSNRVMRFDPFPLPEVTQQEEAPVVIDPAQDGGALDAIINELEVTEEVGLSFEETVELGFPQDDSPEETPELTEESE